MATVTTWLPGLSRTRAAHRASRSAAAESAAVPLAEGERVLYTVGDRRGKPIRATDRAVYHRPTAGGWVRLGWEQIGRVYWDTRHEALVLTAWAPHAPGRTALSVPRGDPLGPLARERVAWTMLITTKVRIGGYGEARVTARRQPGTGHLLWIVAFEDRVTDGQAVRAELDAALARLRAELGR